MKKNAIITLVILQVLFLFSSCNVSDTVAKEYKLHYTVSIRYTDNTEDTISGKVKFVEGENIDFDLFAADRPSACLGICGNFIACYVKTYSVIERKIVELK